MSAQTKLTETPRQGLDPVNPKLAQQYEQLVDLLTRRLSPAHAHLFAEPVPVALVGTGRPGLAWFANVDGEAQPVSQLDAPAADLLRRTAARLTSEIAAFADGLEREGEASREMARLLRDALVLPDDERLWSVAGQPVFLAWGYRRSGAEGPGAARVGAITASAPVAETSASQAVSAPIATPDKRDTPSAAQVSTTPSGVRRAWSTPVLWVAFLLLSGVLADRLLQACAVGDEGWPSWVRMLFADRCPVPSLALDPAAAATLAAIQAADGEVRTAELALTRRALSCDAVCPVPPPARRAELPPTQALPADVERRLEGIERGRGFELTLAWEGAADLDLQIVCPDRSRINFERRAACGGRLVADQNERGGTSASRPVEHVIWDAAPAPDGRYTVEVSLYDRYGEARPEVPFQVVLSRGAQVVQQRSGTISVRRIGQSVLSFDMPQPASGGTVTVP